MHDRVSARGGGGWVVRTPPLSTTGGDILPCWQRKKIYIPYFGVISVRIGHFKH